MLSQLMVAERIFPIANVWKTILRENIPTWQKNSLESILQEPVLEAIGNETLFPKEQRMRMQFKTRHQREQGMRIGFKTRFQTEQGIRIGCEPCLL